MQGEQKQNYTNGPFVYKYIKLKICIARETTYKTKRQPDEWEKILTNDTFVKWICLKYIKNSYNSTKTISTTNPNY